MLETPPGPTASPPDPGTQGRGVRDPEATRDALLAAATELFAARGFSGATTGEIARRARVNKAMISYHFGGKKKLYEAILVSSFSLVIERLRTLVGSNASAREALRGLLDAFAELHRIRPAIAALLVREGISGGRHLSDEVMPHFVKVFGMVREVVDRGVRSGELRAVDPLLTHLTIVGSLAFFFATAPLRERLLREGLMSEERAPTAERFLDNLYDLLSRGLAAGDAPRGT